jgi:hypothetical protein
MALTHPYLAFLLACGLLCAACGTASTNEVDQAVDFERRIIRLCGALPVGDGLRGGQRTALARGTAHFDSDAAKRCSDWVEQHGCQTGGPVDTLATLDFRLPGLCRSVYVGTVALGEPCTDTIECADNPYMFCLVTSDLDQGGTCMTGGTPGDRCATAEQCASEPESIPNCTAEHVCGT